MLGSQYFDRDRQYAWSGDGAFIMHDVLDKRTKVQCVISAIEKDSPKDRNRTSSREFLEETLRSWIDGPIVEGVIEVMPPGPLLDPWANESVRQLIFGPPEPCAYSKVLSGNTTIQELTQTVGYVWLAMLPMLRRRGKEPAQVRLPRMLRSWEHCSATSMSASRKSLNEPLKPMTLLEGIELNGLLIRAEAPDAFCVGRMQKLVWIPGNSEAFCLLAGLHRRH